MMLRKAEDSKGKEVQVTGDSSITKSKERGKVGVH